MENTALKRYHLANRASRVLLQCLVAAIVLGFGCKSREALPVLEGTASPFQEFGTAKLQFYEGQYKRWVLESDYIKRPMVDSGEVLVSPVKIIIYDTLENAETYILADSGSTDNSMDLFNLWGRVYIQTRDSIVVKTERLWWIKDSRKIESDTYVQIETPRGDILRGRGLDAAEDFTRFTFRADVTGKFPDFRRRIEQQDEEFGIF
ncbi:LPS export ABC transporter periplasmic protein LptC [Chitinispirillales bacterium ANBcel5]|uniref:LPS export ABC transporter periplasmic protein LptC n=1 Tax=Cellulosispirillum alkaliphilum TaxID=3039283 RepID=UPI002A58DA8C|nr:LPS export ABC transporter periplasmic protein LptC [Chitinispirillales bacterium ANBcel5]